MNPHRLLDVPRLVRFRGGGHSSLPRIRALHHGVSGPVTGTEVSR